MLSICHNTSSCILESLLLSLVVLKLFLLHNSIKVEVEELLISREQLEPGTCIYQL